MILKKIIISISFFFIMFGFLLPISVMADNGNGNETASEGWPSIVGEVLPACILSDAGTDPRCRDVSIFLILLVNVGAFLFGIVGSLALMMFVYGGFSFIISQGNPDKIKKSISILLSAVIGLVVVFGAYALVLFLSNSLGVNPSLQLENQKSVESK